MSRYRPTTYPTTSPTSTRPPPPTPRPPPPPHVTSRPTRHRCPAPTRPRPAPIPAHATGSDLQTSYLAIGGGAVGFVILGAGGTVIASRRQRRSPTRSTHAP